MAKIELIGVTKRFGKTTALNNINLEIRDKEFFVLFGPAGAGKTTILNNIAGIQIPDEGVIKIGDKIVNQVDPANRDVAMVFENYALYPHMTVYDNIASPLRSPLHKKDEAYIKDAVSRVSKLMKIEMLLERLPSQLSNGQRQRVALGRALVRDPNVFLMDEPLAHLDAKLRNMMRGELKEMQHNFNSTSIYVTHDFMEAMSLADRIAIINLGEIVQIGTSDEIYYMPTNEFVAQLMGDPEINLLACDIVRLDSGYEVIWEEDARHPLKLPEDAELFSRFDKMIHNNIHFGIRPQNAHYHFEPVDNAFEGTVYSFETIGNKSVLMAKIGETIVRMIAPNGLPVKLDQPIWVTFDVDRAIFFDAETSNYIGRFDEAAIHALAAEARKGGA
ncbi:MAG: ABC transporter ATP-binding protein [Clostridia bacterium]|nr:ABC transporter ATP-binding protein [Clostridia bacterium]